jgi:hypothetical protein
MAHSDTTQSDTEVKIWHMTPLKRNMVAIFSILCIDLSVVVVLVAILKSCTSLK